MKYNSILKRSLFLTLALSVTASTCEEGDCPEGTVVNPDYNPEEEISETNKECLLLDDDEVLDECFAETAADDCGDGEYALCDENGALNTCVYADSTCYDGTDDTLTADPSEAGEVVLVVLEEVDLSGGSDFAQDGDAEGLGVANGATVDFGYCAGSADSYAHAWRVQYYDPEGEFPTTEVGLVGDSSYTGDFTTPETQIIIKGLGDANSPQTPNAYRFENGDGTSGTFVFYLCIVGQTDEPSNNVGDVWAIQYTGGDGASDNSNAACFEIEEPTHPCTGATC